jgi:hypothetical protein
MRTHAHPIYLELVVANETYCDLIFRSELKVRILIESEAIFVVCHVDHFEELRIRS